MIGYIYKYTNIDKLSESPSVIRQKSGVFADISKDIQQIQQQIYELENSYLQNTKQYGNIFKGFDNYTLHKSINTNSVYKRPKIVTSQRLFSLSSLSSKASSSYQKEQMQSNIDLDQSKYVYYRRVSSRDRGKMIAEEQLVFNSDSISVGRGLEQSKEPSFEENCSYDQQDQSLKKNNKKKNISKINQKSKNTKHK